MAGDVVLIVEDEPVIRGQLALILQEMGLDSCHADSVQAARAALSQVHPVAVILDLGLTDGSGITLLEEWSTSPGKLPVLVVSSAMDFTMRATCYALGAGDFIAKPFRPREFQRRLERVLESSSPPPR